MDNLNLIGSSILFQFIENVSAGKFASTTDSGLILNTAAENDVKQNRWATVLKVGPKTKIVKPGDYILIEKLMWTNKINFEGKDLWRTDESKVILRSETLPKGIY